MSDPSRHTGLDSRLGHARTALLDEIEQPPLSRIRQRAARRRRQRAAGGTALLAAAVAATLPVLPWSDDAAPPPAAEPTPGGPVYTDAGITINGLVEDDVPMPRGTITSVEFVDPATGFLLSACAARNPCPVTVAGTGDGGATWQPVELPADTADWDVPELVAFPDGSLLARAAPAAPDGTTSGSGTAGGGYASTDGGRSWQPVTAAGADPPAVPAQAGDLLRRRPGEQRCAGLVEVWRPGQLPAGRSVRQPDLGLCWVAPAATADGGWWVGGVRAGAATVAVTRDGGASWQPTSLGDPGDWSGVPIYSVEVSGLGSHAYATVLGPGRTLLAVFHSADGGRSFTRTFDGRASRPGDRPGSVAALAGELVPLLDGRVLATGGDQGWYVSDDDGASFQRAGGNLPAVGRLARSHAGYVAYDLFGSGWAAYSPDGATWRKLQIN